MTPLCLYPYTIGTPLLKLYQLIGTETTHLFVIYLIIALGSLAGCRWVHPGKNRHAGMTGLFICNKPLYFRKVPLR